MIRHLTLAISITLAALPAGFSSDWDEDPPKNESASTLNKSNSHHSQGSERTEKSKAPLQGKIEKSGDRTRLQRLEDAKTDSAEGQDKTLDGKAVDDELRALIKDGSLKDLQGLKDALNPLQGKAELQGGKKGAELDPDADDSELLVEWDRWRNRFLRAVQLGTQENINNPDPEDYVRPRVDPVTGNITSRYPLGTGAAFSCIVTEDGQIKELEIIEPSGFPKYDKAVLRAVQQLAGTQILRFPKGSHRRTVIQPGRIKTATTNQFKFHHFGDVERVPN